MSTINYKVLGQSNPTLNIATDLYTCPAATETIITTLSICNQSTDALYTVAIRGAGVALAPKHYLVYQSLIAQNQTELLTLGLTLSTSDVVTVISTNSYTSFGLFGSEVS